MSTATIVNNLFTEGGELWVDGVSAPLIEGNEFRDGPHIFLGDAADGTIVRDNLVVDNLSNAIGITGPGSPLIEGNTFDGSKTAGVIIGFVSSVDGRVQLFSWDLSADIGAVLVETPPGVFYGTSFWGQLMNL